MENNRYYQEQMTALEQLFKTFTERNGSVREENAIADKDPDVADLIKAFAYLSAELRTQVEVQHSDFYQVYAQHLLGTYLWSKPSATLIQAQLPEGDSAPMSLPAETNLGLEATTPQGDTIKYTLAHDALFLPFAIERVTSEQSNDGVLIHIDMRNHFLDIAQSSKVRYLEFALCDSYQQSVNLFANLYLNTKKIQFTALDTSDTATINALNLRLIGLDPKRQVFGQGQIDVPEMALLLEYVLLPNKLLSLRLDMQAVRQYFGRNRQFRLTFHVERQANKPFFAYHASALKGIKINTYPAINLFKYQSLPIKMTHTKAILPVTPVRNKGEVYVQKIEGVLAVDDQSRRSFMDYNEYVKSAEADALTFIPKVFTDGSKYARFGVELGFGKHETIKTNESIICHLLCTNGVFATDFKLDQPWELKARQSAQKESLTFLPLMPASPFVPMSDVDQLPLLVKQDLAISRFALHEVSELKALLKQILCFAGGASKNADHAQLERFTKCINGLKNLTWREDSTLKGTQVIYGQEVFLTLDPDAFLNLGDVYLFGVLLNRLFASYTPVNYYSRLRIYDIANDREPLQQYRILIGEREIIDGEIVG